MQQLINQLARQQGQLQPSHLVELNAGKMKENGSKLVPDKRKGVLYMDKKDDILQICWKQRQGQQNEDEFMLFNDAKWLCIDEKQLIYCLKFENGGNHFYWIQQYEHEEKVQKIYDLINGDVLKGAEKVLKENKIDIPITVKLSDEFTRNALKPLLSSQVVTKSLFPLLPENHTIEEVIDSVQFKESVASLEQLITSGHLKDILQQLGVQHKGQESGPAAVEVFLKAIKAKYCDKKPGMNASKSP
eukprot:NODE_39_length_29903_cov_0.529057.p11 type:complete len:245 gc:universal NODE_39_length_29903_cov_0.529057:6995-7729(+)